MDKTISLDSLQRLIIMPLKRLIDKKAEKVEGKGLSTNDFTNEEKAKLAGIEVGAQVSPTKVSELENDAGYIAGDELTEADNGKVLGAVDGKIGLVEVVDTTARQEITQLSEGKVDKTYVVELFEELKELILSGNTSGAIALLDQAILDQAVLS